MTVRIWQRVLAVVRLLVALSCVTAELLVSGGVITGTSAVFAAYAGFAIAMLAWPLLHQPRWILPALVVDFLLMLLFLSGNTGNSGYWVGAVFYAYILVSTVMQHKWPVVIAVAAMAALLLAFSSTVHASFLVPMLICGGLAASVLAIEKFWAEQRLAGISRQSVLHRYDAEKARESERQRIAADFHDGPLQSFISFQMRLELIRKLLMRDQRAAVDELVQLQELCKNQVNDLRAFVRSMRPVDVDGSLSATLKRVVEQFQKDSGISASFVSTEFLEPAEPEISLELLQIVREALYNVQKHARATRVAVVANKTENGLEIAIEDNGHGFPFSGTYSLDELDLLRLGPVSIKRRVRTLGGELQLESKPGQGAGLRIRLAA